MTLARLEAESLASDGFAIAEIPHPLGQISEADLRGRAAAAWTQLEPWVKTHESGERAGKGA